MVPRPLPLDHMMRCLWTSHWNHELLMGTLILKSGLGSSGPPGGPAVTQKLEPHYCSSEPSKLHMSRHLCACFDEWFWWRRGIDLVPVQTGDRVGTGICLLHHRQATINIHALTEQHISIGFIYAGSRNLGVSHLGEDVTNVSDWLPVSLPQCLVVVVQPPLHRGNLLPCQRGQKNFGRQGQLLRFRWARHQWR